MGSAYRGAWQAQSYRGAWQQQSQAFVDNPSDTITLADVLTADASSSITDSISLTDVLTDDPSSLITDSMSLTDALTTDASSSVADTLTLTDSITIGSIVALADTINLSDAISQAASKAITDSIAIADTLGLGYIKALGDIISISDALGIAIAQILTDNLILADNLQSDAASIIADSLSIIDSLLITGAGIIGISDNISISDILALSGSSVIDDSLSLADALIQQAGFSASDALTLADALMQVKIAIKTPADSMTITDNVTGILSDGMNLPGTGDVTSGDTVSGGRVRQPGTWRKAMDNNPSPITLYSRSSANTTFTPTGVTDSSAWDLSNTVQGDVLITEDGYKGVLRSAGSNQVIVNSWIKGGFSRRGEATDTPADGQQVSIHKPIRAKKVLIRAHDDNDNIVYIGFDENVHPDNGHPIAPNIGQPNDHVVIEAPRDRWLNLSRIWIVSGTLQSVIVTAEGNETPVGVSNSRRISDSLSITDNLSQAAHSNLSDSLSMIDDISQAAHSRLSDTISITDNISGVLTPSYPIALSDSLSMIDNISQAAHSNLSDSLSMIDGISQAPHSNLSNTISITDNLSAVFTPASPVDGLNMRNVVFKDGYIIGTASYKVGGVFQSRALITIDVSDPLNPSVVNVFDLVLATHKYNSYESVLRGNYLFLATNRLGAGGGQGGFTIWDVTDPSNPVYKSRMEIADGIDGNPSHTDIFHFDVNSAGTIVACASPYDDVELVICDSSNKTAPFELRRGRGDYYDAIEVDPGPPPVYESEWRDDGGTAPKTWLFRGCRDAHFSGSGISTVHIDTIWNLNVGNLEADPNWIRDLTHQSHTLSSNGGTIHYSLGGGDYPNNLQICDGTSYRGKCLVTISSSWMMNSITPHGSYIYVTTAAECSVVDVSDPTNPSVVETTGHYARQHVVFNGNNMFVAAGGQGLRIYDVSDPTNLISLTQFLPY